MCLYEPTFPGCLIPVKPIGMFQMTDDRGGDDKVLCVPLADPYWSGYEEVDELPVPLREEIEQFFSIYKDLEGKRVEVEGWCSRAQALREIEDAVVRLSEASGEDGAAARAAARWPERPRS